MVGGPVQESELSADSELKLLQSESKASATLRMGTNHDDKSVLERICKTGRLGTVHAPFLH